MTLFDLNIDSSHNFLPKDGTVNYYGSLFSNEQAKFIFEKLKKSIEWKQDQVIIFGKLIKTKREVAWYGDNEFLYTYSNTTKKALSWNPELIYLKQLIENKTGEKYNSCLLNFYHNGSEGMAWHSDNEKELKKHGSIASLSFGAERKFSFRHKQTKQTLHLYLENGSLIEMKDEIQDFWLHQLPLNKRITTPRINLTFRQIEQKG